MPLFEVKYEWVERHSTVVIMEGPSANAIKVVVEDHVEVPTVHQVQVLKDDEGPDRTTSISVTVRPHRKAASDD